MSKAIFRLPDGSKWIADPQKDELLYEAPANPPNTGSKYTRGTNLYAHKTKKHGVQFYVCHWSMWQAEEGSMEPVTKEDALIFLEDKVGDFNGFPSEGELEQLKEYGIELLVEDA